ncbi:hypothetical protein ATCC90586_009984 [Pythium insidiosum]|nr:hypothetical protein ATCC90586_009984 [Pythium insidiosum]
MGAQTSSALAPQEHFPPAIHTRFLRHRAVTLHVRRGCWTHDEPEPIEIRDVHTNLVMFRVPPRRANGAASLGGRRRRRLLDMYNVPVATLLVVPQTYARHNAYVVTAPSAATASTVESSPKTHEELALCELAIVELGTAGDAFRCVELPDPTTNELATITCRGHWRTHSATFWLQRGPRASQELIARVHSEDDDDDDGGSGYLLEIAPGVDVALLLLICAALDEEEASRPSPSQARGSDPAAASQPAPQQPSWLRRGLEQPQQRRAPSGVPRIAVPA